jgi:biopolymer transport protein ExbD
MSARLNRASIHRQAPSREVADTNVDVTPVMNMFVILIPFLISMAVFSHLSVLRFSLPGNTQGTQANPALPLTLALTTDAVAVTHGERILIRIPRGEPSGDFAGLNAALASLRGVPVTLADTIVIAVDDRVAFEDVVRCMDVCRDAGFARISLAEGTHLDAGAAQGAGGTGLEPPGGRR